MNVNITYPHYLVWEKELLKINTTEKIADFCVNLKYKNLPDKVTKKAKYLFLDFLGVAWRGQAADSSKPVIQFINAIESTGNSAVIGTSMLSDPLYSCMANGCFGHSLELDDVVNEASLHPGVVIFPVVLSAAKIANASGKEMIAAVVAGYEVMVRLGRGLDPSEHYSHGFHPTGTCGAFAAAAAAAKLLNLDTQKLVSSLGIAGSMAAASMQFLEDGAWTKRFHPGWAAHGGLTAAMLAGQGFKGTKDPVNGKYGFLNSYSDKPKPELVTENLGKNFLINKTSIKPHACCRYNQGPVDILLKIVKENDLKTEDIEKIRIGMVKTALSIVAEPIDAKRNPQTDVDAQFSMPYCGAMAVAKQKVSIDEFHAKYLQSPEIKELMRKIECYHEPDLDKEFPQKWPSKVEVQTKQGDVYEESINFPKGDPENPLTWAELIDKFNDLTKPVMAGEKAKKIVDCISALEEQPDASFANDLLITKNNDA